MKDPRLKILASNIKVERVRKELTQAQLAEAANISEASVTNIERKRQIPNVFMVFDIAKALNIDVMKLFEGIE